MQGLLASPRVVTVELYGNIFGLGFLPYDLKEHQCQSVCLASSQALIVALYVITSSPSLCRISSRINQRLARQLGHLACTDSWAESDQLGSGCMTSSHALIAVPHMIPPALSLSAASFERDTNALKCCLTFHMH